MNEASNTDKQIRARTANTLRFANAKSDSARRTCVGWIHQLTFPVPTWDEDVPASHHPQPLSSKARSAAVPVGARPTGVRDAKLSPTAALPNDNTSSWATITTSVRVVQQP